MANRTSSTTTGIHHDPYRHARDTERHTRRSMATPSGQLAGTCWPDIASVSHSRARGTLSPAGGEGYSSRDSQRSQLPMSDPLIDDDEFILDFARLSEGIYDEKFLRTKYHFVDDATWERLGQDDELVEKIMLLRASRVRSGATKRELAQKHMVRAPDVLNNIMNDPEANHRHVVDAIKTMDALAGGNPENAPASDERFQITIVL